MSNADASEVARVAARARWTPSPVVIRSAQICAERVDEVPDAQLAELEQAIAARRQEAPGE